MGEPIFFVRRNLNTELARALYDDGYCDQQIADYCGVAKETVSKWRRNNNLPGHKAPVVEVGKPKKPSTLVELEAEARRHGLTYGQYMVARREGIV